MGARAQVSIQDKYGDPKIYLYTHWGEGTLIDDVKRALLRGKSRWDDYEYLTRIIFDEMKGDDVKSETGYGISTSEHGDNNLLIEITPDKTVKINGEERSFSNFVDSLKIETV